MICITYYNMYDIIYMYNNIYYTYYMLYTILFIYDIYIIYIQTHSPYTNSFKV